MLQAGFCKALRLSARDVMAPRRCKRHGARQWPLKICSESSSSGMSWI